MLMLMHIESNWKVDESRGKGRGSAATGSIARQARLSSTPSVVAMADEAESVREGAERIGLAQETSKRT